jgi:tetratricopeptide (TPR) repeat protein
VITQIGSISRASWLLDLGQRLIALYWAAISRRTAEHGADYAQPAAVRAMGAAGTTRYESSFSLLIDCITDTTVFNVEARTSPSGNIVSNLLTILIEGSAGPRTARYELRPAPCDPASESDRWMNHQPTFQTNPAAQNSGDVADVFARASACHRTGDLAQAQAGYIEVLKRQPSHFDALHMLGVSEYQRGNSQSAERLLRHSLLVNPPSAATRYALGVILSALQRNDEALVCYDDLIALTPDFVDAHMKRGLLLSGLGRFAEAIVSYDNAIAIDPRHLDALQHKGEALHYLGKFDEAIACYNQILSLQPNHFAALVDRGCAFKDLGRANEAIAEFNLALTIAPDNTIILINRGETRLALRQNSEALEDFDRVISINPRIALGWLGAPTY